MRNKLGKRSREAILLRSLPHSNYRVWFTDTQTVQHVRHVVINEEVFPARHWETEAQYEISNLQLDENENQLGEESDHEMPELLEKDPEDSANSDDDDEDSQEDGSEVQNHEVNVSEGQQDAPIENLTYIPSVGNGQTTPARYPNRDRRSPDRLAYFANRVDAMKASESSETEDMPDLEEALSRNDSKKWRAAIENEVQSVIRNKTWTPVNRADISSKPLDTKVVLKIKRNSDGSINKYKARLVVKGYQQNLDEGIYAPVVDFSSIRLACAMTWANGGEVHQMDVSSAFLNGTLDADDPVYIERPTYLGLRFDEGVVLRLNKALYGLKNAPRAWNRKWNEMVTSQGFKQLQSDTCVYRRDEGSRRIWVLMYVDDILVMGTSTHDIERAKRDLSTLFCHEGHGKYSVFLGR